MSTARRPDDAAACGLFTRTGARLALLQSLIVVLAFVMAGYISQLAIGRISRDQMRRELAGEMLSMDAEFKSFGPAHLPLTVAKRSRLWRGFDYRWTSPDGRVVVGALPPPPSSEGWATVRRPRPGEAFTLDRFMVLTKRMPDGAVLSIGRNLTAEGNETSAVSRALIASGALGVSFCLAMSYLFSRGAWRRIEALARSAGAVTSGKLDARVSIRSARHLDDIDQLGAAFNGMLDRLEEMIAHVRQVSSDIAHDLRTPLSRVRQRLEDLRRSGEDPATISLIETDLDEVLAMFSALLRLAEIESEGHAVPDGPVDLAELARRMAEIYRPDIESSGRALSLQAAPAIVRGDAQLINQALANLLDNVLRHTPPGAPLEIATSRRDGAAVLSVTDRGPGVPAEHRELALQRCRRLDPSRPGSGSGLGLAIVAAIARRHGAQISLADARPGLTVALAFPVAPA
jgi:signal transduction histidine kinase